ncbi:hypothetical protein [Minwuia thermotolerans]|uniref:hypothetical protein n=1 Tax=Minwuia thermotolerans TaxID=2056226 RepID=UPI000D6DC4A5|nr:hypothetical protein [Minwuia thermotolerans]
MTARDSHGALTNDFFVNDMAHAWKPAGDILYEVCDRARAHLRICGRKRKRRRRPGAGGV